MFLLVALVDMVSTAVRLNTVSQLLTDSIQDVDNNADIGNGGGGSEEPQSMNIGFE